jgi:hypothetical protein
VRNQVANSGAGEHTGTYNNLYGNGTGSHYGTKNFMGGSATGSQFASYNLIDNSSNALHYGSYTSLSGAGNGSHYGAYTVLSGVGDGVQYGTRIRMSGTGSGNKYGVYALIPTSAGGTNYAIYAESTKGGTYAGYFKGYLKVEGNMSTDRLTASNIVLNEKIKTTAGGMYANMLAYIYGSIDGNYIGGNIVTTGSSSGFNMDRLSEGRYKITMASAGSANNYIVNATLNEQGLIWINNKTSNTFVVNMKDGFGSSDWVDGDFQFVVYRK